MINASLAYADLLLAITTTNERRGFNLLFLGEKEELPQRVGIEPLFTHLVHS